MKVEILDAENNALVPLAVPESIAPYEQEVRELLCSCWSPPRIFSFMRETKNVIIPVADIYTYLDSIPADDILEMSILQAKYNNLSIKVDALGEMERLLRLSSDRMGAVINIEKSRLERIPYLDTAIAAYWKMLREFVAIQQSIGALPMKGATALPQGETTTLASGAPVPTLRGILFEMTGIQIKDNKR